MEIESLFEIKKRKNYVDFVEYLEENLQDYLPYEKNYSSYYHYVSSLKEELKLSKETFNILGQKAREIALS